MKKPQAEQNINITVTCPDNKAYEVMKTIKLKDELRYSQSNDGDWESVITGEINDTGC